MRRLPSLLLVLLVLSSGCAGFLPWSDSGSTRDAPTATSAASLSPPPGANGQWIFDAERLLSAHEAVLDGTNYRKKVRIRPNQSTGPPKWANSSLVAHIGGGRLLVDQRGDTPGFIGMGGSYKVYVSNATATYYIPTREETRYRFTTNSSNTVMENVENNDRMSQILSNSDFTWNETTVRNGTKLYRYRASPHTELPDVKALSATVFVDERGLVHELSGTLTTIGSRPTTVDFSYRFSEVESPPTKPNWVNNVPHISVKSESESDIIAIEHEGGAVVPAGTTVRFSLFNRSAHTFGDVELSKPLEPGDVAYLSVHDLEENRNGQFTADGAIAMNQPPTNESTMSLTNRSVSVGVRTGDWSASAYNSSSRTD
jgi:hypothetical protein